MTSHVSCVDDNASYLHEALLQAQFWFIYNDIQGFFGVRRR